jgi:outer membrane protein
MIAIVAALRILTLGDAVSMAMKNGPTMIQAHANTQAAEARVIQRRAPLLPQLTSSALYQRTTSNFAPSPGVLPMGTTPRTASNSWDTFNNWNFNIGLTQLVWDFGVSYQTFRAAEALARSQSATERATLLTIEAQARTAYFTARAQKALTQVASETLANQDRHLQQISGFVRVGTRPEIDLAQARTDRANAQVQLINAENNYSTAKAQLNLVMGLDAAPDYDVADETLPPIDGEDQPTDTLLVEALKSRPELVAFEQQVEAQRMALKGSKGAYAPAFSVGTAASARGTDITDMGYNWNAGVTMRWDIFTGLSTYGVVKEAAANLTAIEAQLSGQKQQVRLDVEQARLAVRAAKAALTASDEALINARERLRLAEGRYQAGVGSVIELSDAQLAMTTASAQRVQADYTVASARAQLLHALGRL